MSLGVIDLTKEFEQFVLVFLLDAKAIVDHGDDDEVFLKAILSENLFDHDRDTAFLVSKIDGVGIQIQ